MYDVVFWRLEQTRLIAHDSLSMPTFLALCVESSSDLGLILDGLTRSFPRN